jgi:hypothetical protein
MILRRFLGTIASPLHRARRRAAFLYAANIPPNRHLSMWPFWGQTPQKRDFGNLPRHPLAQGALSAPRAGSRRMHSSEPCLSTSHRYPRHRPLVVARTSAAMPGARSSSVPLPIPGRLQAVESSFDLNPKLPGPCPRRSGSGEGKWVTAAGATAEWRARVSVLAKRIGTVACGRGMWRAASPGWPSPELK